MKLKKAIHRPTVIVSLLLAVSLVFIATTVLFMGQKAFLQKEISDVSDKLSEVNTSFNELKNVDQYKRNEQLEKEIKDIENTYSQAAKSYEEIVKLEENKVKTEEMRKNYAEVIYHLSKRNVASASALLADLDKKIQNEKSKTASSTGPTIPANVTANNTPPGSGYSRQYVKTEYGTYMIDIIAADLNSNRVIVDTASEGTCTNDCPVDSLGSYASRSGAWAGINGPYFCPESYPSCADKKNSFDTLLMNKNKVYFNSDNNVYSTVPAVIFSGNSARFVGQSLEWGRDTSVDAVIASQPMLLSGGNITFGGDDEVKRAGKGSRSFIGAKGNTAYIGVVHNANVAEVAVVLKTLGLEGALNLDSGGSTALWTGGRYIVGPGRNTPFGILFVSK